jgi:hypothetical protein
MPLDFDHPGALQKALEGINWTGFQPAERGRLMAKSKKPKVVIIGPAESVPSRTEKELYDVEIRVNVGCFTGCIVLPFGYRHAQDLQEIVDELNGRKCCTICRRFF